MTYFDEKESDFLRFDEKESDIFAILFFPQNHSNMWTFST